MAGFKNETAVYPYKPSQPAAVTATIIFGFLFAMHLFKLLKTRTWFCVPFVIGAIFEFLGFGARVFAIASPTVRSIQIMQTLLILLAPILFAASIYMFLGRIITATGRVSSSMIRPARLTKVFVGDDIICFLVQAIGGAMLANAKSQKATALGQKFILFGLFLQIVVFVFFTVVAAVFHRRVKWEGMAINAISDFAWETYLNMLYIVSVIITLRNLFRVIEFAIGKNGYLLAKEWPLYVFDALPMAIVLGICCLWYVGDIRKIARTSSTAFEMIRDTEDGSVMRD